ncbi:hypothetical protein PUNSTDRAFT_144994 [Punctularia strigosozonata HHB-11173 SS5]|uniref:uncharacterized protein n=1 Tax=Punctularia strigosozonata (strain HHB-11173) TaxID=741275 RepID=UPI0004417196|nr:uncharacterized protein PUNSTDRAFT_144994 [Punctularia strigosozonata HHB-11173 SS5]EIN06363.1 hypothetical protein PUNSTDRAFT_144994 [Punctularia strigosozonata HHB-11173 SS5]
MQSIFPALKGRLQQVQTLTVVDFSGSRCDEATMTHLLENYRTASCLCLEECEFVSHYQLDRLVSSFPNVRDLRMEGVFKYRRASANLRAPYTSARRLEYHSLVLDHTHFQIAWACSRIEFSVLRRLSIRLSIGPGQLPDQSWVRLTSAMMGLEEIELDFTMCGADADIESWVASINPESLTHLRSLVLRIHGPHSFAPLALRQLLDGDPLPFKSGSPPCLICFVDDDADIHASLTIMDLYIAGRDRRIFSSVGIGSNRSPSSRIVHPSGSQAYKTLNLLAP